MIRLAAFVLVLAACATTQPSGDDPVLMVQTLAADDMAGRRADTAGSVKARAYLTEQLEERGLVAQEQPFSFTVRGFQGSGTNLLTRIDGKGDGDQVIVVTAHFDHLGEREGEIFNGADDNASGTAMAVELAGRLRRKPAQHDVIIALVDAEEMGLQGARALFGEGAPLDGIEVAANLNFDMVGRDDGDELWIVGTYHTPALRTLLEPVAEKAPIPMDFGFDEPTDDPRNDWTLLSDHGAFHRQGIPFIYLGVEDHADYHRPSDTFENFDPEFFVKAIDAAEMVLRAMDAGLEDL